MHFAAVLVATAVVITTTNAQIASEEPLFEFKTTYGWVEASNCLTYEELKDELLGVARKIVSCGLSYDTASNFTEWIVTENVYKALEDADIVCIPPELGSEIGTRLGDLLLHQRGPRWLEKRRRDDAPKFEFDGKDRDNTIAQKSCCQCSKDEFPRGKGQCRAGPCCPRACLSLTQLSGGSAKMVTSCCERSVTKCFHKRKKGNSEGQRGRRPPAFT
ncbi:hypothetical protein BWQ96_03740 [Gracilariopsis chorda]|uniref:Uncharacterized protein n=1 Tax=Gracilariopsis chorda TaxID=448386 RepID=A0A2V3IWQ9_9FLOR|nr:hypothetical protein BWQ96_03740 [Gracilariopsis chorda]|eukprot:PXF46505.1 hypothetical protein BWQ96_03740 [Gracilariopsis chorda]